jgi:hypothetical protein
LIGFEVGDRALHVLQGRGILLADRDCRLSL